MSDTGGRIDGIAGEEQAWNERQLSRPVTVPCWRTWDYRAAAVVLGCSQRALLADAQRRSTVPVLLRSSGGGAVLTGPWMLGLSILLPPQHPLLAGSLASSYRWLGELFAQCLRSAGIGASTVPVDSRLLQRPAVELLWACFASTLAWEVVVGERKIVGLSQRRRQHGVLLAAGLLFDVTDWSLLCAALDRPRGEAAQLARCTTSCREQAQAPPTKSQLIVRLTGELERVLTAAT